MALVFFCRIGITELLQETSVLVFLEAGNAFKKEMDLFLGSS